MVRRSADIWIGAGLLIFCGLVGWRTLRIPSVATGTSAGPDFVPWLMIAGIVLLSLVMMSRAVVAARSAAAAPAVMAGAAPDSQDTAGGTVDRRVALRIAIFIVLLVAYSALFMTLGYLATTVAVFIGGMALLGERHWLALFVVPAALTAAIYYGFTEFLGVWLP